MHQAGTDNDHSLRICRRPISNAEPSQVMNHGMSLRSRLSLLSPPPIRETELFEYGRELFICLVDRVLVITHFDSCFLGCGPTHTYRVITRRHLLLGEQHQAAVSSIASSRKRSRSSAFMRSEEHTSELHSQF